MLETSVALAANVKLRLPDLVLVPLSTNDILGDLGLDNRPAHPLARLLGRFGPEATLRSSSNASAPTEFAECGARGDLF